MYVRVCVRARARVLQSTAERGSVGEAAEAGDFTAPGRGAHGRGGGGGGGGAGGRRLRLRTSIICQRPRHGYTPRAARPRRHGYAREAAAAAAVVCAAVHTSISLRHAADARAHTHTRARARDRPTERTVRARARVFALCVAAIPPLNVVVVVYRDGAAAERSRPRRGRRSKTERISTVFFSFFPSPPYNPKHDFFFHVGSDRGAFFNSNIMYYRHHRHDHDR